MASVPPKSRRLGVRMGPSWLFPVVLRPRETLLLRSPFFPAAFERHAIHRGTCTGLHFSLQAVTPFRAIVVISRFFPRLSFRPTEFILDTRLHG
jgi:hypothetical protein